VAHVRRAEASAKRIRGVRAPDRGIFWAPARHRKGRVCPIVPRRFRLGIRSSVLYGYGIRTLSSRSQGRLRRPVGAFLIADMSNAPFGVVSIQVEYTQ
jgi:hypothetical protein